MLVDVERTGLQKILKLVTLSLEKQADTNFHVRLCLSRHNKLSRSVKQKGRNIRSLLKICSVANLFSPVNYCSIYDR
jgi:hypothetical protein